MAVNSVICGPSALVNPIDADAQPDPIDVCLALRTGIESVGCPHQVAAAEADYTPDYWSRVLSNTRGVLLNRLGQLPRDVQLEFLQRWAQQLGARIERRAARVPDLAGLLAERRIRVTLESL